MKRNFLLDQFSSSALQQARKMQMITGGKNDPTSQMQTITVTPSGNSNDGADALGSGEHPGLSFSRKNKGR